MMSPHPLHNESTAMGHAVSSVTMDRTVQPHQRRTICGDRRHNSSRLSTHEFSEWIAPIARRYTEKDLAELTGLSVKAVQNLRSGLSAANGTTVATWCMNDPGFAAEFAEYVGLIRPGEAEFAGAITQAFNAYVRREAQK